METQTVVTAVVAAPREISAHLARMLVEERCAACVQIIPLIRSIYRWEGAVQDEEESLLLVKTTRGRVRSIEDLLHREHPYEVPELLIFPASGGLREYLEWVREQT